jgi:hypothetical protein
MDNLSTNMKKSSRTFVLVCLIFCACQSPTKKTSSNLEPITGKLNVLYLENYLGDGSDNPHAQLQKLLEPEGRPGHPRKDKLIFHSYHNTDNYLTYGIWPTENGPRKFDNTQVQILKVGGESGDVITGQEFYFGDQQLVEADISVLKTLINQPEAKYILFKPLIITVEDSYHNSVTHLFYQLYKSTSNNIYSFTDKYLIQKTSATGTIPVQTDPSPPAKSN